MKMPRPFSCAHFMLTIGMQAFARSTRRIPASIKNWMKFWRDYRAYAALSGTAPYPGLLYPCLGDDTAQTEVEPIYFYQDAWAFEQIASHAPARHVDVGSHHKFVSLLSRITQTTMVDIRPLSVWLPGLDFRAGSILNLPFGDKSIPSLSSLCVIEHVGLGRYGDALDPNGSEKAISELKRVTASGGNLYVSAMLDDENRVYFNAHRAFTEGHLLEQFAPFQVIQKRYIYRGQFLETQQKGCGVGCYHLRAPE